MNPSVWRPEDVEGEWLEGVLRRAGLLAHAKVTDVDIEPVGTGQMGDSYRFSMSYDRIEAGAPRTLVGKFTAADESSRSTGVAMRTAEVEVRFYQQIAPTLKARTAACYYADVDPQTARFALLLEDLSPAVQGDQLTGCSIDQAAAALVELAAVHAPRWAHPALCDLEWLNRRDDANLSMLEQLLPALFDGFVERYSAALSDESVSVGENLFPRIGAYLRADPGPQTVQHSDYRVDNLMFLRGDTDVSVAILDWQTVVLGPGLLDASYLLGGSLQVEHRRQSDMDLLREYHRALAANGVSGYSFDDCFRDYRRYAYAGYVMAVAASMMVERTPRGDDMFMAMANRHAAQVVDLEADRLLEAN